MSLDSLNLAEQQLLSRVAQAAGLIEEKHQHLLKTGVFREYGKIYEAYVDLLGSEGAGLEALKRALFLYWYQTTEPSSFSGLHDLAEGATRKLFEVLEKRVGSQALDFELRWMLRYYNVIAEWAFSCHEHLAHLNAFLISAAHTSWSEADLKAEDFVNRGQMGDYWLSIIKSKEKRSVIAAS